MSENRIAEIRARLDAVKVLPPPWFGMKNDDFIAHAPADIAWLLEEVETLVGVCDAYKVQSKRLLDEVERLQELIQQMNDRDDEDIC